MFFRVNDFWVFSLGSELRGFYCFSTGKLWLTQHMNKLIKGRNK